MGTLTGFHLLPEEVIATWDGDSPALRWEIYQDGPPGDAGLPPDYEPRSKSCDKAWEDMIYVLKAIGWNEVVDWLTDQVSEIEDPGGSYLRWVSAEGTEYVAHQLSGFDAAKTTALCIEQEVTGYDGDPLHELDLLD